MYDAYNWHSWTIYNDFGEISFKAPFASAITQSTYVEKSQGNEEKDEFGTKNSLCIFVCHNKTCLTLQGGYISFT